jgi:hypothetical protein
MCNTFYITRNTTSVDIHIIWQKYYILNHKLIEHAWHTYLPVYVKIVDQKKRWHRGLCKIDRSGSLSCWYINIHIDIMYFLTLIWYCFLIFIETNNKLKYNGIWNWKSWFPNRHTCLYIPYVFVNPVHFVYMNQLFIEFAF